MTKEERQELLDAIDEARGVIPDDLDDAVIQAIDTKLGDAQDYIRDLPVSD